MIDSNFNKKGNAENFISADKKNEYENNYFANNKTHKEFKKIIEDFSRNLSESRKEKSQNSVFTYLKIPLNIISVSANFIWENSPLNPSANVFAIEIKKIKDLSKKKVLNIFASDSLCLEGTNPTGVNIVFIEKLSILFPKKPLLSIYWKYVLFMQRKKLQCIESLKEAGDFLFLKAPTIKHHLTMIIQYRSQNDYLLTVINSGEGIFYHEENENKKKYTRMTFTNISKESLQQFVNELDKHTKNKIPVKMFYEQFLSKIRQEAKFDPSLSYCDHFQMGSSCSVRQELLMLKQVISSQEYNFLKILIGEETVLDLIANLESGQPSMKSRILLIDALEGLRNRYGKNKQKEMWEIIDKAIKNIKIDLSKNKTEERIFSLTSILNPSEKIAEPLIKICEQLQAFDEGDLQQAREKIEDFYNKNNKNESISISKFYKDSLSKEEFLRINGEALTNCIAAFVKIYEHLNQKTSRLSMEQWDLLLGISCNIRLLVRGNTIFINGLKLNEMCQEFKPRNLPEILKIIEQAPSNFIEVTNNPSSTIRNPKDVKEYNPIFFPRLILRLKDILSIKFKTHNFIKKRNSPWEQLAEGFLTQKNK